MCYNVQNRRILMHIICVRREAHLIRQSMIWRILRALLLIVFLPVVFCVVIIGNNMDYSEKLKLATRLPNQVLLLIALAGMVFCIFLFWKSKNVVLSFRANWITNGVLALIFLALYYVNVWVAKQIAFNLPWDIMITRGVAYEIAHERPLEYFFYLSMYTNNIPISYILGRLYRKAMEMQSYPYVYDFIWIQVNCALISIAGFFSCLLVKKLTKKLMPVIAVFLLYLVLVGISPWKIAPYTDTYGLIFPIICIYFYVCYRKAERLWSKYLCLLLSIAAGMVGGFIKPNLYIVVIAILGNEFVCFLADYKKIWQFVLTEIILAVVLAGGGEVYKNHIIDEIGLDINKEIEASWQCYFYMGLNEEATGSYSDDLSLITGEFQTSKSDKNRAALERAFTRMKDRGFWGSIYFYLKKMVMTFNDGLFGWKTEVWIHEEYPAEITSNTALTQRLRSIFWGNELSYDVGGYNALCQLTWIFSIMGIPGICLCKDKKKEDYSIFIICFLGIFFYQMLFEARARYLFVFLPVLLPIAICGIQQYMYFITSAIQKRKQKACNVLQDNVVSDNYGEVNFNDKK